MEDDDAISIEEDLYEGQTEGLGDEPEISQVEEVMERLEDDWQSDNHPGAEAPPETANTIPPEIVRQFGAGQWSKTYEERGETTFNFQTGEMMSKDGSISLTRQIQEHATGEQVALHEQVVKGWMENSGSAQLIAFTETADNGVIIQVTRTWVESGGQVASETWSREIPKEEQEPALPGLEDLEHLIGDYDDDLFTHQNTETGKNSFSVDTELSGGSQKTAEAEVATNDSRAEKVGIETQDISDDGIDSAQMPLTVPQAEVLPVPDENLLPPENLLSLEQPVGLAAAVELDDDYDEAILKTEANSPSPVPATGEKITIDQQPDFLIEQPALRVQEIPPAYQEQAEPDPVSQFEGISIADDPLDLDYDFQITSTRTQTETLRPENEIVIEVVKPSPSVAAVETYEEATGIEITDDDLDSSEDGSAPMMAAASILQASPEYRQQFIESPETTGITLLEDNGINAVELYQRPVKVDHETEDKRSEMALKQQPAFAEKIGAMDESVPEVYSEKPAITAVNDPAIKNHEASREVPAYQLKILQIKPEAKELAKPILKVIERMTVKTAVFEKDGQAQDRQSVTEKVLATKQRTEVKTTAAPERVRTTPTPRYEQGVTPARLKTDTLKLNQQVPQATFKQPASKPIIVKFTKKAPLPFRPTELINRILTFKPAVVTGNDEATNNSAEVYIPEFELAA